MVIGNPPYVEYRRVKTEHSIHNFTTHGCGNLYAYVLERCCDIVISNGRLGQIIPISFTCSRRMSAIRKLIVKVYENFWVSNFAIRPQSLFGGVTQRNTILLGYKIVAKHRRIYSTNYLRWYSEGRNALMQSITYVNITDVVDQLNIIPKINILTEDTIIRRVYRDDAKTIAYYELKSSDSLYYHDSGESYWTKTLWEKPKAYRDGKLVNPSQWFRLDITREEKSFIYLLLNSNIFYWLWTVITDCRHMTKSFIRNIPLPTESNINPELVSSLQSAYQENTILYEKRPGYKSPEITVHAFKPILDSIDSYLAKCYGFTDEELDFIINYDIKYRMGLDYFEEWEEE